MINCGTDIVKISRLEKALETPGFYEKVFGKLSRYNISVSSVFALAAHNGYVSSCRLVEFLAYRLGAGAAGVFHKP